MTVWGTPRIHIWQLEALYKEDGLGSTLTPYPIDASYTPYMEINIVGYGAVVSLRPCGTKDVKGNVVVIIMGENRLTLKS